LEGSNNDGLGTVTAQRKRQQQLQQQEQAIDLVRLRDSVWITALVTAESRQQRLLIQACKIRDLYHSIQQTSPRCSTDNSLNRSALSEIEAKSIPYMYVIEFLFLLEKSEQSSSVILLLFLIAESIAHPSPRGSQPLVRAPNQQNSYNN
jgi:hypothetical protein